MEILFIDDDNEEFEKLQALINGDEVDKKPNLYRIHPSENITGKPDVILIDYQLTNPEGIRKSFKREWFGYRDFVKSRTSSNSNYPVLL